MRVEGRARRGSIAEESDAYFATRPRGKQVGAWASAQSRPLASRARCSNDACAEIDARFAGRTVPRPPFWGGFRLAPERIEFWKAGEFRLHDRLLYTRDDGWRVERLAP